MPRISNCPLCKATLSNSINDISRHTNKYVCPNCGIYWLPYELSIGIGKDVRFDDTSRTKLSYAVRQMQDSATEPVLYDDLITNILRNTVLPTALEQLDKLVLFLGQELSEPGSRIDLHPANMRAVLGAKTDAAADWIIDQASHLNLIEIMAKTMLPDFVGVTLTLDGWNKFIQLQTNVSDKRRAFMAMPFGDSELDRIFFEYFKPAAKRAGYELMKLDEEPRAGLIDDRLRLEIRTARFLVADLSHSNRGAYWEAGYAEGLGRPVIYTCKQSVLSSGDKNIKPHFDTNHYLMVPWDPLDLQNAADLLTTTIRVTLPTESLLTDD